MSDEIEPRAIGDDAAAAGMDLVSGGASVNQGDDEINKTRDYIAQRTTAFPVPVGKGGTGSTTAAGAAVALNVPAWTDVAPKGMGGAGKIPRYSDATRLQTGDPASYSDAANKGYVDAAVAGIPGGGGLADGPTSAAYNRGQTGSGWFAVWMNSALQFMRSTSSRRFKTNIREWRGSTLRLRPVVFDRIDGDPDEVGFVAEEVLETLPEAVVYFDGDVDGISDRVILAAVVADLQALAERIAKLEE